MKANALIKELNTLVQKFGDQDVEIEIAGVHTDELGLEVIEIDPLEEGAEPRRVFHLAKLVPPQEDELDMGDDGTLDDNLDTDEDEFTPAGLKPDLETAETAAEVEQA